MRKGPDGLNGLLPFGSEWASVGDDDDVSEVLLAANDPTQCRGLVHPLMNAGDVLFFSGGATAHGDCTRAVPGRRAAFTTNSSVPIH